jgi:hypothetical protein
VLAKQMKLNCLLPLLTRARLISILGFVTTNIDSDLFADFS